MKLVERAYEWLKKQPKEHIETMRKDVDGALATIIDAFRDKSITREQVQIILTEKSEAEKQATLIDERIEEVTKQINALVAEREELWDKRNLYSFMLKENKGNDLSSVYAKMQEHREEEARQREQLVNAIKEQQQKIAQATNASVTDVEQIIQASEGTQTKSRRKPLRG